MGNSVSYRVVFRCPEKEESRCCLLFLTVEDRLRIFSAMVVVPGSKVEGSAQIVCSRRNLGFTGCSTLSSSVTNISMILQLLSKFVSKRQDVSVLGFGCRTRLLNKTDECAPLSISSRFRFFNISILSFILASERTNSLLKSL